MFSRKVLRVKAMQYLFAFFVQDKAITTAVVSSECLTKQRRGHLKMLKEGMAQEIVRINHILFNLLELLVRWVQINKKEAELLCSPPCSTLSNNYLFQRLEEYDPAGTFTPLHVWPAELVRSWYDEYLKAYPPFSVYTAQAVHNLQEDKAFVTGIVKKVIFKHRAIQKHIAWEDIGWSENRVIVQRFFLDLIEKFATPTETRPPICAVGLTSGEKAFYTQLVSRTVEHSATYEGYIAKQLKNWDLARIAFLDRILLKMGLTEAMYGEDMPKGVIINEYLNLAMKYSTPKSHLFINGVLEALMNKVRHHAF